jgi:hypothetical protein
MQRPLVRISQHGFSSLCPSTWFLRDATGEREEPADGVRLLHLQLGGPTAASHAVIELHPSHSEADLEKWRQRSRWEDRPSSMFTGRAGYGLAGDGEAYGCDYREGCILGHIRDAWLPSPDGRVAWVSFFCCALEDNPRRDSILKQSLAVWKEILESWRWENARQGT